ncbi:1-deoxy-D-xylulose 5-phosphate reductoisomerase [Brevinematales bacterium NS]|nr:1-deoxy-D-xylulose 5-phosphate reductoisomerase [Brevinematales bacterium NS]
MPKKVVLLGATGSIGSSTLEVIRRYPEEFSLIGLSGHSQTDKIRSLVEEFHPSVVCLPEIPNWASLYPGTTFLSGEKGLGKLASLPEADMIIIGISGLAGLLPTIEAIKAHKHLLSANKEAIAAAGPLINQWLSEAEKQIIPLDSEHNAIFTLLSRFPLNRVKKIILTASGGPFFHTPATPETTVNDVLNHPTWNMGSYITVNSATMLNKGFEVIEAHYLFRLPFEQIDVLIHPQSLVHGMIELSDGTHTMVASPNHMKYPIAMAMFYPDIPPVGENTFALAGKTLEFYPVPYERFPLLSLAYEVGKVGGLFPLALNALNEEIVSAFLKGVIHFLDIERLIQKGIELFAATEESLLSLSLDSILPAEQKARTIARDLVSQTSYAS